MKNLAFYMLALRAFPAKWASAFSDEIQVVAASDTVAPSPPSELTAESISAGLTVSWLNPVLNADGSTCNDLAWVCLYRSTVTGIDKDDPESYDAKTLMSGESYTFNTEVTYGAGRYYRCLVDAVGAVQAISTADRGYTERAQVEQFFAITAIDRSGNESLLSGEISETPGTSSATDSGAIHTDVSGEIAGMTEKTAIISADKFILNDSENSDAPRMGQVGNLPGNTRYLEIRLLDKDTAHEAGAVGGEFRVPVAMTIVAAGMYFDTAGSGSVTTLDVKEGGATILSTKITVDAGEKTSKTAAAAPVVSDGAYAADAILTFVFDGIASGTAGEGLTVWMQVKL